MRRNPVRILAIATTAVTLALTTAAVRTPSDESARKPTIFVDSDRGFPRRLVRRGADGGGGECECNRRGRDRKDSDWVSSHSGIDLSVRSICFLWRPSCWPRKISHWYRSSS